MSMEKEKYDAYCWKCCRNNTDLNCEQCVRSFHINCLMPSEQNGLPICPVCIEMAAAIATDNPKDLTFLPEIMERVAEDKAFSPLKEHYPLRMIRNLVNPINLKTVQQKIGEYKCLVEFRVDIQWIVHNFTIAYSNSHHKTRIAYSLLEFFNEEIASVRDLMTKCVNCYENAVNNPSNWISMLCSKVHLIIWAKMRGYNFWPAKLMSIDGQLVSVRFFGDHSHTDVPAANCYLYSKSNPDGEFKKSDMYNTALEEAKNYIECIRQQFGSFEMAKSKTMLNSALHDRYISDMIPEYFVKMRLKCNKSEKPNDCQHVGSLNNEFGSSSVLSVDQQTNQSSCLNESPTIGPSRLTEQVDTHTAVTMEKTLEAVLNVGLALTKELDTLALQIDENNIEEKLDASLKLELNHSLELPMLQQTDYITTGLPALKQMENDISENASTSLLRSTKIRLQHTDDSCIPLKKPRIFNEINNSSLILHQITASNHDIDSSLIASATDSLVWEHFDCKQDIEQGIKMMNNNMMKIIDSNLMKLLNANKKKFAQTTLEADITTNSISNNNEFIANLRSVTFERDSLKNALIAANRLLSTERVKLKENDDNLNRIVQLESSIVTSRAKFKELKTQLQSVTKERDHLKAELAKEIMKPKENSADKIRIVELEHDVTAYRTINKELTVKLQVETIERDKLKSALAKATEQNVRIKKNNETSAQIVHLENQIGKLKKDLNDANNIIIKIKAQSQAAHKNAIAKYNTDMAALQSKLNNQHFEALLKAEMKYEREKSNSINDIQQGHQIEMELEKTCTAERIKSLTKAYSDKMSVMEKKIRAAAEEKKTLEAKYASIVAALKNQERTRISKERHGKMYCLCGKMFTSNFLCSNDCTQKFNGTLNQRKTAEKTTENATVQATEIGVSKTTEKATEKPAKKEVDR